MGFCHIGQAGLKLLTSSDVPTWASQRFEITGMSHCTWLQCVLISILYRGRRNVLAKLQSHQVSSVVGDRQNVPALPLSSSSC